MLRSAVLADLPVILAIRDRSGADALSDPTLVTDSGSSRLIAVGAVIVAEEAGSLAGFAAVDGDHIHLLVDTTQRSKGIGRALLTWARDAVCKAGHPASLLTLTPGSTAEHHYRAAGWVEVSRSQADGVVLKKPC
jgi:GNAT superfamily N-acetyltransferase